MNQCGTSAPTFPQGHRPSEARTAEADHEVVEFEDAQPAPALPDAERTCPWAFFQVCVAHPKAWKALVGDSDHSPLQAGLLVKRHHVLSLVRDDKVLNLSMQPACVQTGASVDDTLLMLPEDGLHELRAWQEAPEDDQRRD